jgi:hypothetical protein
MLPLPDPLGGSSSSHRTGIEGALANTDSGATSEVVVPYQNPDTGLYDQSALRRWAVALCVRGIGWSFPR